MFPGSIYAPPTRQWKFNITLLGGGTFYYGGRKAFFSDQKYKIIVGCEREVWGNTVAWESVMEQMHRIGRQVEDGGVMEHINA